MGVDADPVEVAYPGYRRLRLRCSTRTSSSSGDKLQLGFEVRGNSQLQANEGLPCSHQTTQFITFRLAL
jgi:hypothetical protein